MMLAALAVAAPSAASASEDWYGRIDVGVSVDGAADISSNVPLGGDAPLDDAALGALALGFARDDGWRVELELSRREHDLAAAALLDPGGSVEATALLVNLYRDFGDGRVIPYLGFGLGLASVDLQAGFTPPLSPAVVDDTDGACTGRAGCGGSPAGRQSDTMKLPPGAADPFTRMATPALAA